MPGAAELTPHLAAAMPRVAALVPWLLIWGVTMIVLSLAASVLIARSAASPRAGDGGAFADAARRLRRGRRVVLIVMGSVIALWGLSWLAGGPDPMWTELIFGALVAGWLGPLYVAMRIFHRAMTRAVARARMGKRPSPSLPDGESARGGPA
jgi:hypothetical protein